MVSILCVSQYQYHWFTCRDICRKPLGEPNPQSSNLALAVVLLIVQLLQAGFNAWQDFSTSKVMSSIKGMLPSDVLVLRDGNEVKLPASELVQGDLIHVRLGEKVPADLRLIQASGDLRFDRSILTGEVSYGRSLQNESHVTHAAHARASPLRVGST